MQFIGTFGRGIGLNPDEVKLEDSTKLIKVEDSNIFGGSPMALKFEEGVSKLVSYKYLIDNSLPANLKPYGISKFQKNEYADETFDKGGLYGSGKGTVIQLGRISLFNNVFRTSDNGVVQSFAFDTGLTYTAMQPLYVNLTEASESLGKITNVLVESGDDINTMTLFGYVSAFYSSATQPVLEILVK